MRKFIFTAAFAALCSLCAVAQQPAADGQPQAAQKQKSNRIQRLEFFLDKLYYNPFNISVVAGSYIVVQDVCNTPTWDEIRQAQDIVSEMFAVLGDAKPDKDAEKIIIEKEGETLMRMGQELNEAAKNYKGDDPSVIAYGKVQYVGKEGQAPLYVIDGQESMSVKDLKASNVESMKVIHGREAIEKYGERAVNGVVIIKLKK